MCSLFFSVAPNHRCKFYLSRSDFFLTPYLRSGQSVSSSVRRMLLNIGGKAWKSFPCHFFFCQLTAASVTIEPCVLIDLGSLSPLLQPRATHHRPRSLLLTSVCSIYPVMNILPVTQLSHSRSALPSRPSLSKLSYLFSDPKNVKISNPDPDYQP